MTPGLPAVPAAIAAAYAPGELQTLGHELIDELAAQLAAATSGDGAVVPWQAPAEARQAWAARLALPRPINAAAVVSEFRTIIEASTKLHHPRCAGHQVAPPLPLATLAEMVAAHLNNGVSVYEMGPAGAPIELAMVRWMCASLGMAATADGVFTSGGSLGNLTALLAMRRLQGEPQAWSHGVSAPVAIIASAHAHYSITRALAIMGWGEASVYLAAHDEAYRLTVASVEAAHARAKADGRRVVALVAALGATPTGACDPLAELGRWTAAHHVWFHVDGAHGASVCLAPGLRALAAGIEYADSVVWDAHKLLMLPALVTGVLFRDGRHAYAAFAQEASYLFHGEAAADMSWWDVGLRSLECTKRMMAMELYMVVRAYGAELLGEIVTRLCAATQRFAELVQAHPRLRLALAPTLNIVCYRWEAPALTPSALNQLQAQVRARIAKDGRAYIVSTMLGDTCWLRSTFMNPLVTEPDLAALITIIDETATLVAAEAAAERG